MKNFIYAVAGPPMSGKSAFCYEAAELLKQLGRKVKIVNMDPANHVMPYKPDVDIQDLIQVRDVMVDKDLKLGPNSGLLFCMEYIEKNIEWLLTEMSAFEDKTFIFFDMPGQSELYYRHHSVKNMFEIFGKNYMLCCIYMVDASCCQTAPSFVAFLTTTLGAMVQLGVPHINVLSRVDLIPKYADKLAFGMEFYTEVMDLQKLVDLMDDGSEWSKKYKKLTGNIAGVIEQYGLVNFIPCSLNDERAIYATIEQADNAVGYHPLQADDKGRIEAIRTAKHNTDIMDLVSHMNEKYVQPKKHKKSKKGKKPKKDKTPKEDEMEIPKEDETPKP